MNEEEKKNLTKEEMERLDRLLAAARGFHYLAFVVAGISLAISSCEEAVGLKLPVGDIIIPRVQGAAGLYLIVVALTLASERLSLLATPWLRFDTRRPPFAWIASSPKATSLWPMLLWLLVPLLLCAFSTSLALERDDITGIGLSFAGTFIVLLPSTVINNWSLITSRLDHRGGAVTLSIWLLYWLRLLRGVMLTLLLLVPVVAVVPKWRGSMSTVGGGLFVAFIVLAVVRMVGAIPLTYRCIDRLGPRFGFPVKSQHYH